MMLLKKSKMKELPRRLRTAKQDKEIDEKLKKIQEAVSASDEQAKQFKQETQLSDKRFIPVAEKVAEKAAKLATILDGVDTDRVRLFTLGYQALDYKRMNYVYTMLHAIG